LEEMGIGANGARNQPLVESFGFERLLASDYRKMSECIGGISFRDFNLGYGAMEFWYEEHPMRLVETKAAVEEQGGASADRAHTS
jgi:hypothetical protein